MLRSGHGKPGGSAARFSEVGGAAVVRGSAVTSRSASSRSGPAGGSASAVGEPLGSTTEARRTAGAEAGRARRAQSALTARKTYGASRSGLKRGPQALGYETSLWTSWRVAHLIEQECGVQYHPSQAWRILRQLGWSCQRPVGRALERDEEKIRQWKQQRWPEIKKKPKKSGELSSSSTKAD